MLDFIKVDFTDPQLHQLLTEHLTQMQQQSPPESIHALDLERLKHPTIAFWRLVDGEQLIGCCALKTLGESHAEVKSMRVFTHLQGQGYGKILLSNLLSQAQACGFERVSLETGTAKGFEPARKLYQSFGFDYCPPFADYSLDPNSTFMSKRLTK